MGFETFCIPPHLLPDAGKLGEPPSEWCYFLQTEFLWGGKGRISYAYLSVIFSLFLAVCLFVVDDCRRISRDGFGR